MNEGINTSRMTEVKRRTDRLHVQNFDKKPFFVQMIRVKASLTLFNFKASRKRQDKTPPTKQTDLDILTGFDWF
jgi:hypothetical protein